MTKPIEYKPSPFRLYFPLIMFCSSLILTLVNIGLYHFWKYSDIYLLITNVINIVGFFIIVIIQIVRSTFINHIKSLFLTWDIHHKLVILRLSPSQAQPMTFITHTCVKRMENLYTITCISVLEFPTILKLLNYWMIN